jgi:hypothetical protein
MVAVRLTNERESHESPVWSWAGNSLLWGAVGPPAARARRSKLSASSRTAFLAPGSLNCPATSRACSARSSHSRDSLQVDGISSSHTASFVADLVNKLSSTKAIPRAIRRQPARSRPKERPTRVRLRQARHPAKTSRMRGEMNPHARSDKQRSSTAMALYCRPWLRPCSRHSSAQIFEV